VTIQLRTELAHQSVALDRSAPQKLTLWCGLPRCALQAGCLHAHIPPAGGPDTRNDASGARDTEIRYVRHMTEWLRIASDISNLTTAVWTGYNNGMKM